ncbi:MAG: Ig-like domain-containing protein [Gemmatimonadota bacterium]|nr:Ig-like domain-containing protein [Gemmatimonadota bacterium]
MDRMRVTSVIGARAMATRWPVVALAMASVLLSACRSDGAVTASDRVPGHLGIHADVSAPSGATLLIRAFYLRRQNDGPSPADTVELARVTTTVGSGSTPLALDLDLHGCIADPLRVTPGRQCAVLAEITLLSGTTVIDRAVLPPTLVGPGAIVEAVGTVVLGNVARIDVTPLTNVVRVGQQVTFTAVARDAQGVVIPNRIFTWTSDNTTVAGIPGSEIGIATGASPGTAHIIASTGGKSGQATLTVIGAVASVAITPNPASVIVGSTTALTVTAKDGAGNVLSLTNRTVSWTSGTPAVATITQAGVATGVAPGASTITATVDGVSGTDVLTVFGARIVASPTSLDFIGEAGNVPPGRATINITNGGLNPLDGLALTVTYAAGQPTGWLLATLSGTTAPTTIVAGPDTTTLPLGDFTATIHVTSARAGNSPLDIPVQYHVRVVFTDVQAGGDHTCGQTEFGEIYCWGLNDRGQLGNGTNISSNIPVRVSGNIFFSALAVGASHTCGFGASATSGNALFCWGANGSGQLGDGTLVDRNVPIRVSGAVVFNPTLHDNLAAGGLHTCAVDGGNRLWCWGDNSRNQLGIGPFAVTGTKVTVPTATDLIGGKILRLGAMHSCSADVNGNAICWGDNTFGQLGSNPGTLSSGTTHNLVIGGAFVQDADTGPSANHGCFVKPSTAVMSCWGANAGGQLGDGTRVSRFLPAAVGPRTYRGQENAFGSAHTCAIISGGATPFGVDCWGSNSNGQLGVAGGDQLTPNTIPGFRAFFVRAGDNHTCALRDDNAVYCWGKNNAGQLGDGTNTDRSTPTMVKFTEPLSFFGKGTRITPTPARHR